MANQVKIQGNFNIRGGFSGNTSRGVSPDSINRTTTATSGTEYFNFHFNNSSVSAENQSQKVTINCHYTWSVTYDEYANMTLKVHGYVDSIVGSRGGSGNPNPVNMFLQIGMENGKWKVNTNYSSGNYANIYGGADLGEITKVIPSGSTEQFNTIYVNSGYANHINDKRPNVYVDEMWGGLTFSNPNAIVRVAPVITSECKSTSPSAASLKATIDYKNGNGTKKYSYCVSTKSDFSSCVKSGSGTGNAGAVVSGLQPNTRYYVKWTADNGYKTGTSTCQFVTLTPNTISAVNIVDYSSAKIKLVVQNGGKAYAPSMQLQYKKCSDANWTNSKKTNTTSVAELDLTGLDAETCYQVRAITTTTAGSYTGNTVQFVTPAKALCLAYYTSLEPAIDPDNYETTAKLCYRWETNKVPATITPYYRIKNGYDPTWIEAESFTVTALTGTHCFTLTDLFPNQTVYETYLHTSTTDMEWDGEPSEFITPLLPIPDNHNCENFEYLWDLLCQAVSAIATGRKDIYSNPYTKSLCDPFNPIPTHLTLWSRMLRFMHAVMCLACDMANANLTTSKQGQYLVGEAGWVDFLETVVEGGDEAWRLVYSDGVYKYIKEKMHTVWHYHEAVDYLVNSLSDLEDAKYSNATKVIVASENKVYQKVDGNWVLAPDDEQPDNFAVYHINYASDTSFGIVRAGSAYYYWEGTWNNLDSDITRLAQIVKDMDKSKDRLVMNETGVDTLHVNTVDRNSFNCSSYPSGERWVSFVTEPTSLPAPVYHTVNFIVDIGDSDDEMPTLQSQQVVDGGTAQMPSPIQGDCDFIRWEDQSNPGVSFNFDTVIKKDYNIVLKLDCGDYIATESSVIITAENGDKFVK